MAVRKSKSAIITTVNALTVPDYSLQVQGISQSLLGSWQNCRRRFLLEVNRWQNVSTFKNTAYGSMVHEVLDRVYSLHTSGEAKYADLGTVIEESVENHQLPAIFKPAQQESMKAMAQAVLEGYIWYYKKDFEQMRFEAIESQFEVPFREEGFILRGKKDGRFRAKDKSRWHIEHKTKGRISEESMMPHLAFDLQNLFYMLADKIEFGQLLHGVLYNILRNPEVRKELSPPDLYKYLQGLIQADPKHYYIRYELPYSANDLAIFQTELHEKLLDLQAALADGRLCKFYKNECNCEGGYACPFLQACSTGWLQGYTQKETLFTELSANA